MPFTSAMVAWIWFASSSSFDRFGPITLTALAPLTPDRASSTLS